MPFYRVNGLMVHLKLGGKAAKNPPAPCAATIDNPDPAAKATRPRLRCCGISIALCDWPQSLGGTCDAPLCTEHATETGPDQHLCPTHLEQKRRAGQENA